MSFFDSNENKRLRSIGKVLQEIKTYTKFQGKQACQAVKATEVVSSIKKSQFLPNKSFFSGTKSGPVKHQSLKEDDEAALWRSEDESESHPQHQHHNQKQSNFLSRNKLSKSNVGKSSIPQQIGLPNKKSRRGIKVPFLKH